MQPNLEPAKSVLAESAEAILTIANQENALYSAQIILEQYLRCNDPENGLQFASSNPRCRYVVLRGAARFGKAYAEQKQYDEAMDVARLILEIERKGAEDFANNGRVIVEAIVASCCLDGEYQQAIDYIRQLPIQIYNRRTATEADFEAARESKQEVLLIQVCATAARQGDTMIAFELLEKHPHEFRKKARRQMAVALAANGDYQLAIEQLKMRNGSNLHRKTVGKVISEICKRGDFQQAIDFVESVQWQSRRSHNAKLGLILRYMVDASAAPEQVDNMVYALLDQPKEDGKPAVGFSDLNTMARHLFARGDDETIVKHAGRGLEYFFVIESGLLRLRRTIARNAAGWLRNGNVSRYRKFVARLNSPRMRLGFYTVLIEQFPEQDSAHRRNVATCVIDAWIEVLAACPADDAIDVYELAQLVIEFKQYEHVIPLFETTNHFSIQLKEDIAIAMLHEARNKEADRQLVEMDRRMDELLLAASDGPVPSLPGWMFAKLECGLDESAERYFSRLGKQRYPTLKKAFLFAIGKPGFDSVCRMMVEIHKEAPPESGEWTSRLNHIPIQPRIRSLNLILKYFPECRWAHKLMASALAESGAIAMSVEIAIEIDVSDAENGCFAEVAETACRHGRTQKLLAQIPELNNQANRDVALRWICPDLARTDEIRACELARSIANPQLKSLTLALVAKTMVDNQLGEEEPDP